MIYVPLGTTNIDYGWRLSEAMWLVTRPQPDSTRYYTAPRSHPETSEVYLPIDPDDTQRIDQSAELAPLIDMLTGLSSANREQIASALDAQRGQTVRMAEIIPDDITVLTEWPVVEEDESV